MEVHPMRWIALSSSPFSGPSPVPVPGVVRRRLTAAFVPLALAIVSPLVADDGIRFLDRAAQLGAEFEHVEPPRGAILEALKQQPFQFPNDFGRVPHKPHGAPGVAIFDFDRDGDLDVYVTNSVGGRNALFSNQLRETGELGFVDVAEEAGVDAFDHDSTGVCYGDVDNDGDHDLMVLGAIMPNRLYENRGDGTFADITAQAGVGGGYLSSSSCTMGDVDGDGLLDIVVANTHTDWTNLLGIVVPFAFNEHNQLYHNLGGNVFGEVTADSGIEALDALPPTAAALTWAVALVDYDLDGDVDLFSLDDQGGVPHPSQGGVPYGLIHLHRNDGSGQLTDVSGEAGLALPGNWMGVAFGDLDCDGNMDFFATNAGDYPPGDGPPGLPLGVLASRWFLGRGDGTFVDPGVGDLVGTVFGWGTAIFDYDNDGDADVAYVGAIDVGTVIDASNPGVVLENRGCSASFAYDPVALGQSGADHTRRIDQGLAIGDLDGDGRVDVVTVSNANLPPSVPLVPRIASRIGSPFDDTAFFVPGMVPIDPSNPFLLIGSGVTVDNGSLSIELATRAGGDGDSDSGDSDSGDSDSGDSDSGDSDSGDSDSGDSDSGDSDSRSASVTLMGTIGLTSGGRVNRDGIGAVVTVTTRSGLSQMVPIVAGGSYASQNSLTAYLGLGDDKRGTVEVLWPGGVRNRLRDVRAGERILFPEIPCDVGAPSGPDEVEGETYYCG
ncbi:MAG: CRTAC1 family protein, partial [Acidobacteria bacterium]